MENNKKLVIEIVHAIKAELEPQFGTIGKKFEAIDKRFDAIDRRFDAVDKRFESVDKQFTSLEENMSEGFRHQGVLLEAMQDDIDTLVDGQEILHEKIDRIEGTVTRIVEIG